MATVSYKKLWKLLIDRDLKKKICALLLESVLRVWQSSQKTRMLLRTFWSVYVTP